MQPPVNGGEALTHLVSAAEVGDAVVEVARSEVSMKTKQIEHSTVPCTQSGSMSNLSQVGRFAGTRV